MTTPADKMAIIKAVLRGETLTTFEAAVAEKTRDAAGEALDLTMAMVQEALTEVTMTIFPHCALDSQKQWMKKYMKKPQDMSIRLTTAALNRLNNCLTFFPGGSEAAKFMPAKLVEILEFLLLLEWRQKFDLDGYIPTDGNLGQLIRNGEAKERNLDLKPPGEKKENSLRARKQ